MDASVVVSLLALVIAVVALLYAHAGRRQVRVVSQAQAARGESQLDIFYHDFLREIRRVGEPNIHIHDVEVIARRALDKVK